MQALEIPDVSGEYLTQCGLFPPAFGYMALQTATRYACTVPNRADVVSESETVTVWYAATSSSIRAQAKTTPH
jgi:hypothetical protein